MNCCFNECGVSRRRTKSGIKYSLFKIPTAVDEKSAKWRSEVLNVVTKYRVQDEDFKRQQTNDTLHICERHYLPDDLTIRKYKFENLKQPTFLGIKKRPRPTFCFI